MSVDPSADNLGGSHAGWKLDMLQAMAKDPAMRRVDVAVAVLVIQKSNHRTKESAVTDRCLEKEARCNRASFARFRERGNAAGWFDCVPGRSGRATIYRWKSDRLQQIRNMTLDQRILDREEEDNSDKETARSRSGSSVQKTKPYDGTVALRKASALSGSSAKKTKRWDNAEKTQLNTPQCTENLANSAQKTEPLHTYSSLEDSLPDEDRSSTREAPVMSDSEGWADEDWQARFDEIAGHLEYDEQLPRDEAEGRARVLCGFDNRDAGSRWSAGTAPPTVAKHDSEEGMSDDQNHSYHAL